MKDIVAGIRLFVALVCVDLYRAFFVSPKYAIQMLLGWLISPLVFVLCLFSPEYRKGIAENAITVTPMPSWCASEFHRHLTHPIVCFQCHAERACKAPDHPCHLAAGCPYGNSAEQVALGYKTKVRFAALHLSREQIVELADKDGEKVRIDTPEGETPICAYCGTPTKQPAYTYKGRSWPPCCSSQTCLERWEPKP